MNVLDRFTRDPVSRFLWGGLTVSFALLLVFALSGERGAIRQQERDAQTRAIQYTETTLQQNLDEHLVIGPMLTDEHDALLVPIRAEIMVNDDVARVRLFELDGSLLFSTDAGDRVGSGEGEQSVSLGSALGGETTSVLVPAGTEPKDGFAGSDEDLYQTYVPLHLAGSTDVVGAAEVDARHALLVAAGRSPWRSLQLVFGAGLLIFLGLTLLSIRRSANPMGATVDLAALVKSPRLDPGGDDPVQLRRELAEARSQLRQAEEAYRFLEARSKSHDEGAPPDSELTELRAALTAAEASGNQARTQLASGAKAAADARVRELEEQLMQERLRRANAERAAREVEENAQAVESQRVQELEIEVRSLRELVNAEDASGVSGATVSELDALKRELEAVRFELDAARLDAQARKVEAEFTEREQADASAASLEPPEASTVETEPTVAARPRSPQRRKRGGKQRAAVGSNGAARRESDRKPTAEPSRPVAPRKPPPIEGDPGPPSEQLEAGAEEQPEPGADEQLEADAAAQDLRARLVRTAAAKKPTPHGPEDR
jgi:hypothetical protein